MKTPDNFPILMRFSSYIACSTAVITCLTFIIAFLTPPLSGPFCQGECFTYPYHDISSRFPRDYFWMYFAMLGTLLYCVLMVCIHYYAIGERKIFSHIGLSMAIMASIILVANYFIQVSVIQPSLKSGETDGIAILTQYNPHGIFIALEEIGFFLICVSFIVVVPVFQPTNGLHTALRLLFIITFLLAVACFTFVSMQYGMMRQYRFEVAIISLVWFELIISSILLAMIFTKVNKKAPLRTYI
jgi:hypothetical protein